MDYSYEIDRFLLGLSLQAQNNLGGKGGKGENHPGVAKRQDEKGPIRDYDQRSLD